MRVVDHETGVVFFLERHDLGKLCYVAGHRKDAVGDYELGRFERQPCKFIFERFHVAVLEFEHVFGKAETRSVKKACVVLGVMQNIGVTCRKRRNYAEVRLKTRRERDCGVLVEEVGKLLFKLEVEHERAVQEARAGASRAVFIERSMCGRDGPRVVCKAQIVV